MRFTIEIMRANVPNYLAKLYESIERKCGIKLVLTTNFGEISINGASDIIDLDVFLDSDEAIVGGSFLMLYMLKCYKELLVNTCGLGRNSIFGNIRLVAAIFEPGNFPPKSKVYTSIADYSADFDILMALGEDDAEVVSTNVGIREEELNTDDFFVTFGASFDIGIRDSQYSDLTVYQHDSGLQKLQPTPSNFTAADLALREFFGIFFCKIHPKLRNRMTNRSGGGDSIRNMEIPKIVDAGSYYHLTIPHIPIYDVNQIKSNFSNITKWKSDNFPNLEKLSPLTVKTAATKYPELTNFYEKKVAEFGARFEDYPPIFDVDGNFDVHATFEYERLFIYAGMQLKHSGRFRTKSGINCQKSISQGSKNQLVESITLYMGHLIPK
jgi:hypothetical protein